MHFDCEGEVIHAGRARSLRNATDRRFRGHAPRVAMFAPQITSNPMKNRLVAHNTIVWISESSTADHSDWT